jgi:hypothetical protein
MATQISHLPHIKNVKAGMEKWDPMHQSIFEVGFTVPGALADQGFTGDELEILSQQVVSISGLDALQKIAGVNSQKFLGVDVSFLNPTLDSTTAEFSIVFNLNLRNTTDAYVLNLFKAWGRLSYDIGNGKRTLKKDYTCDTMHISEANRDGTVWREVIFKDVFITALAGLDTLDYNSSDARQLTVTFRADYWEEKTANYVIGGDNE